MAEQEELLTADAQLVSFIPQSPAEASKTISMLVATVAAGLVVAQSGGVSLVEWLQIAAVLIAAVPVYLFSGVVAKAASAFVGAGISAVIPIIGAGGDWSAVDGTSWLVVLLAAGAAIGVGVVPNAPWTGAQDGTGKTVATEL
jgi:hypothetical protein